MQVRLRDQNEPNGKVLGEVPWEGLDTVIPTLRAWGVTVDGDSGSEPYFGQFVLDETGAYFEVVLNATE